MRGLVRVFSQQAHIFSRWLQNHLYTLQLTWFVRTLRKINLNAVSSRIEREMFEDLKVVLQRPLQSLGIVHCRKVVVPDKSGSCSRRGCVTCHQWLLSGAERWKVFLSNSEKCPSVTLVRLNILNEWVDNLQAGCFWPTANGVCFRGGLCQGHVVQTSREVDDWPKKRQQSNVIDSPYGPSFRSNLDQAQKLLSLKLEGTVG